ncbi:hypothetical protein [Shewanella atlantica]|uniref:Response regulator n=1 Tax=Shewanella atlantica TaxID=271099 RepID=A0A431VQY1_9GAMM|nr:hypothetical protein [Shewanella atlantica]RTR25627.1 hypothetical protein EKG39_22995 [Shewanella atlantica]
MTQSKIRVNEILIGILKITTLTEFTAIELKKMFIEQVPNRKNKETSQLVHRTLNKLCRIGFLEKHSDGKKVLFTKTLAFDDSRLCPSKPQSQTSQVTEVKSEGAQLQKLKATLNQYQIDLLEHIGEAEEFKRLFTEYPETKATLYSRYMEARNLSSSIVGKIKAIEACINALEEL